MHFYKIQIEAAVIGRLHVGHVEVTNNRNRLLKNRVLFPKDGNFIVLPPSWPMFLLVKYWP